MKTLFNARLLFMASVMLVVLSFTACEGWPPNPNPPTGEETPTPEPVSSYAADINKYILSLQYDPKTLLMVVGDGTTILKQKATGTESPTRTATSDAVILCTRTKMSAERNFDEVAIFQPTRGVVWPGALIEANQSLVDGTPTPITSLKRAPVEVNIDLPGIGDKGNFVVENPDYGKVRAGIDNALEWWNNNAYKEGYVNASRSSYQATTAYSSDQLAISLGLNAKWTSGSASGQFNYSSDSKKLVSVVMYKQVFYTATFAMPSTPATVFDASVTTDEVKSVMKAQAPPAYVASIDYGRFVMFRMETSSSETSADAKAALEYGLGGVTVSGSTETKYKNILKNSSISVITMGGNAEAASQVVSAQGAGDLAKYLHGKNAVYSKSNPGEPIAYKVNFLQDNSFAKMGSTTEYVETQCKEQKNGYIEFFHQGGYVAKFKITWQEQGKPKEWNSGDKTAGWRHTVNFPGDATNFNISAIAYTGVVWQPENQIMKLTSPGIPNKCYKVWGTTLDTAYGPC